MRARHLIFLVLFSSISSLSFGQNALLMDDAHSGAIPFYISLGYDNDLVAKQDYGNTQNIHLIMTHKKFEALNIQQLFFRNKDWKSTTSISLHHNVYTPENLRSTEIQTNDYPYSALFYASLQSVTSTPKSNFRISSSLHFGYIGPTAGGKNMQTSIHELTGSVIPQGWHNQISGDVLLNAGLSFQKQVHSISRKKVRLNGLLKVDAGTMLTAVKVGSEVLFDTAPEGNKHIGLSAAYLPAVNLIARDITTQGGMFSSSIYTLESQELRALIFTQKLMLKFRLRRCSIKFFHYWYSETIKNRGTKKNGGFSVLFQI